MRLIALTELFFKSQMRIFPFIILVYRSLMHWYANWWALLIKYKGQIIKIIAEYEHTSAQFFLDISFLCFWLINLLVRVEFWHLILWTFFPLQVELFRNYNRKIVTCQLLFWFVFYKKKNKLFFLYNIEGSVFECNL